MFWRGENGGSFVVLDDQEEQFPTSLGTNLMVSSGPGKDCEVIFILTFEHCGGMQTVELGGCR